MVVLEVLLFNSPIYNKKVDDKEDFLPLLGLGYIATQLKQQGIDVEIIDCVNDNLTVDEINRFVIETNKLDGILNNVKRNNKL